jgi:hypothetical protein
MVPYDNNVLGMLLLVRVFSCTMGFMLHRRLTWECSIPDGNTLVTPVLYIRSIGSIYFLTTL